MHTTQAQSFHYESSLWGGFVYALIRLLKAFKGTPPTRKRIPQGVQKQKKSSFSLNISKTVTENRLFPNIFHTTLFVFLQFKHTFHSI